MTRRFTAHTGVVAVLQRDNVDTDAIIPSREMKQVGKTGLADGLFANWRYTDVASRQPNPEFVLNRANQAGTTILLAGHNFGCGSSREHAVWALSEWGIKVIIAPSFGAIFFENCVRNGVLPLALEAAAVAQIASAVSADPQSRTVSVDLERLQITAPDGTMRPFVLDSEYREQLLSGLDQIDRTSAKYAAQIQAFEDHHRSGEPWMFL
ncbi:3-isopropylmalate dehydratase small subunit [Roseateles violae]|uniref:3-isopropylmalate dehydratase small subunit n=1 Tax=Roseateles violae TaxID=3058042 RepID=A0ABT8DTS0_9BURK|nr:3-isopropylmalate dehydratase small subunit [Pelomonas sp. PFR6]MDN3920299.1 3-isopropylmalate dehydratase small subunit [Pelomonas sp. PFR6]